MSNAFAMTLVGVALMAVAIWGPTVFIYRRKLRAGEAIRPLHLGAALALEVAAFITVAVTLQVLGLRAGEYLLVVALVVGGAGAHVLSSITFVPRA
jgi:hypothetical protein